MTQETLQVIATCGVFIVLCYCAILFRSIAITLSIMSENLRILNDRLVNIDHKINVIEVKLEKLRN